MTTPITPLHVDGIVPYPADAATTYRAHGWWTGQTHAEMLAETVAAFPDRAAIVSGETMLTYAQLGDRVRRMAAGLAARGIRRGDRVVVHLPNVPEYLPLVFALFELGALPVFALAAHRRSEIEYFVTFSKARGYITIDRHEGADLAALARDLVATSPTLMTTVVVSHGGGGPDIDTLLGHDPIAPGTRSLPSDVAFLQLSGGTTGRSKMIPRTHDDYLYSVRESNRVCAVTADTVQLVALPISHNFTMSSPGVLGALAAGATVVLAPNPSPDTCFPLIERHRVTQVSLVPPLLLAWLNSSARAAYDLSSLAVMQVGGAKLSAEVARRVAPELGCTLQQVFGMAEGLVNYTRLDDDAETIIGTQGRPLSPDDEVRVVDDSDEDVRVGTPGNLLTRGPYTIRGYYRAPEHNMTSFTPDGFYRTGDIVVQNPAGYITVVGRSKDQINRGGEKIAPEEVENVLLAHPAIHDVSVVGVPDPRLGQRTKAFVIPRDGVDPATVGTREVRRHLREHGIASYKIPDIVEVVERFPQTGVGKISKRHQQVEA